MAKENFSIDEIEIQLKYLNIMGTSPLLIHDKYFYENEERSPMAEFIDTMRWITEKPSEKTEEGFMNAVKAGAKFGFPALAIKAATTSVVKQLNIAARTELGAVFDVKGTGKDNLVEIVSDVPKMREDVVLWGKTKDNKQLYLKTYGAQFDNWSIKLPIIFINGGKYTYEQLVKFINFAGSEYGIGHWRPEHNGSYGMFKVVEDEALSA